MFVNITMLYSKNVQLRRNSLEANKSARSVVLALSTYSVREPMRRPVSVMWPRNSGPIPSPSIHPYALAFILQIECCRGKHCGFGDYRTIQETLNCGWVTT